MKRFAPLSLLPLLIGFGIWEGLQNRSSPSSRVSVLCTIAVVVVMAAVAGARRQPLTSRTWLQNAKASAVRWRESRSYTIGVIVWLLIFFAIVGWDLNSFVHEVHDLPTLSYLIGRITRMHWGRALLFACWLGAGVAVPFACRAESRRRRSVK